MPKEVLPPEFVAVTVSVAIGVTAFGIPEITPVVVSMESPLGKAGATL